MFNCQHLPLQSLVAERDFSELEHSPKSQRIKRNFNQGKAPTFLVHEIGALRLHNHFYVYTNVQMRK